jgi:hypothetical protein
MRRAALVAVLYRRLFSAPYHIGKRVDEAADMDSPLAHESRDEIYRFLAKHLGR